MLVMPESDDLRIDREPQDFLGRPPTASSVSRGDQVAKRQGLPFFTRN